MAKKVRLDRLRDLSRPPLADQIINAAPGSSTRPLTEWIGNPTAAAKPE